MDVALVYIDVGLHYGVEDNVRSIFVGKTSELRGSVVNITKRLGMCESHTKTPGNDRSA